MIGSLSDSQDVIQGSKEYYVILNKIVFTLILNTNYDPNESHECLVYV